MEDLRLVNLTEICPSQRGECFKAPCKSSGWMKMQVNNQTKSLTMENLQLLNDSTTKQARTTSTRGIEVGALNR